MKNLIIFLILILLPKFAYAKENLVLKGYWFECEFSEKTVPPKDQCEMLDNDGFNFKGNVAINVKNISSKETKCKKNKIGQCFQSNTKSINVTVGRSDQVKFQDSNLILTFLGCSQKFKLKNYINFIEAMPDKKKCFWTGKKHFYLKKFDGSVNIKK